MDMTESITPRSDQINAEDMLTGPRTITITDVTRGTAEQPVNIHTEEFGHGRPYKPSKTMRRIIVAAWGPDTSVYIGRRITIYRDPDITFGPNTVGGIRISALSKLDKRLEIALQVRRGQRAKFGVDPLPDAAPTQGNGITAAMIQAAGFENDDQGRADWLAFVSDVIGRTVNGTKELTSAEAAVVIEKLGEGK